MTLYFFFSLFHNRNLCVFESILRSSCLSTMRGRDAYMSELRVLNTHTHRPIHCGLISGFDAQNCGRTSQIPKMRQIERNPLKKNCTFITKQFLRSQEKEEK